MTPTVVILQNIYTKKNYNLVLPENNTIFKKEVINNLQETGERMINKVIQSFQ